MSATPGFSWTSPGGELIAEATAAGQIEIGVACSDPRTSGLFDWTTLTPAEARDFALSLLSAAYALAPLMVYEELAEAQAKLAESPRWILP